MKHKPREISVQIARIFYVKALKEWKRMKVKRDKPLPPEKLTD